MGWPHNPRPAKSLIKLREQINAAFPNRSKISDGLLGDPAHSSRASDHNPNAAGVVTAIDVTHDPVRGCDGRVLSRSVTRDPRAKYVIFDARIWKARTGQWERYTGPNKHRAHVHISIKPDVYDDVSPWQLSVPPTPLEKPVLKLGDNNQAVRIAQAALKAKGYVLVVDGNFGKISESVTKEFQKKHGLAETAVIDEATWAMLEK